MDDIKHSNFYVEPQGDATHRCEITDWRDPRVGNMETTGDPDTEEVMCSITLREKLRKEAK